MVNTNGIIKSFETYRLNSPEFYDDTISIKVLTNSQGKEIFIIVAESGVTCEMFFETIEEAEMFIKNDYAGWVTLKEVDLDDQGYGTIQLNEQEKVIFFPFRGGYTWVVKSYRGKVQLHEILYGTLSEAKYRAKQIYSL